MGLPAPNLDDRHFQDIVDDAKRRIHHFCPTWTNHNLADPGVALIELFAWMTDLTLYRINQVPDRLHVKFLELMGIRLFGATSAQTDLTFWVAGTTAEVVVPAGTEVASALTPDGDSIVFMTNRDLVLRQPRLTACVSSGKDGHYRDCWDDLQYERTTVTCFPSKPLQAGDCFYLGFDMSLADLVVGLDIDADDIQGVGVEPSNPPLLWEAWSGESWVPVAKHEDMTGGLNRDGRVVLRVPAPHAPLTLANQAAHWLRVRLLKPAPGQPNYTASPCVYAVRPLCLGGTVPAHHSQRAPMEALGRSDGRPAQTFTLSHTPVLARRPEETIQVITAEGVTAWSEVEDFGRSDADDRHFTCDDTTGEICFGPRIRYPDGSTRQHGAVPAAGAEIVHGGYRYGGGERGNVPAASLVALRTTIPYIDRVVNLGAARGGMDAESIGNARLRGPLTLRSGERAVTAGDYEHLAERAASRVARTKCLPPSSPGGPVRLLVVPRVDRPVEHLHIDDFGLPRELIAEVRGSLDRHRMLGTTIEIDVPYYQGVTVAALVKGVAGHSPDAVRQRVLALLYELINPITGGIEGDGWPFDTDLNASVVAQLVAGVEGVERVGEIVLFTADLRNEERRGTGRDVVRLAEDSLFMSYKHRVVVR